MDSVYADILRCTYIKDSQKIKKWTKISRVTDEGWNSQKELSGPVKKREVEGENSCILIQSFH